MIISFCDLSKLHDIPVLYESDTDECSITLTYFAETLYPASLQTNKKALIPLRIRAFPNFAFLRSGAYGTRIQNIIHYVPIS